jgi:hypothetical protein
MSPNEWAAVIGCVLAILTAVYSMLRFMVRAIMRELSPNGGASMKDQISRIEERLDHVYKIILERHAEN